MAKTTIICAHCGVQSEKESSAVNRAIATGMKLYCTMECSGLARRLNKTNEQKKAEKREYDKRYRAKNRERLKAKKAAYFQRTYNRSIRAISALYVMNHCRNSPD